MGVFMEKYIHELFNEDILMQAAVRYSMDRNSLTKIGGFENFVYGYTWEDQEYILRLTHSSHREKSMVQSELDFIEYLSLHNAAVSKPVYSLNHELVEKISIDENNYFLATAFTKAPGKHMQPSDATDELFTEWGRSIGKMHRLTKDYVPKSSATTRPLWYEDPIFLNPKAYLPEEHHIVGEKLNTLADKLKILPKDKDSFGLMHTDIHTGNFYIHEGKITIFDFDDSAYQYFISDIAIALFYCLLRPDTAENKIAFANHFLHHFLAGYREENQLSDQWLALLPDFLKLRELELYVVIYRSCDMDNPGPWEQNYMNGRKERIEKDVPYLGAVWDIFPHFQK